MREEHSKKSSKYSCNTECPIHLLHGIQYIWYIVSSIFTIHIKSKNTVSPLASGTAGRKKVAAFPLSCGRTATHFQQCFLRQFLQAFFCEKNGKILMKNRYIFHSSSISCVGKSECKKNHKNKPGVSFSFSSAKKQITPVYL